MEQATQKENFSNNVIWYNFILCVLVVFIHTRNDGIFTQPVFLSDIPVFNEIEVFLSSYIGGAAVGGFYLGSGYLFFRNYSWEKALPKYKSRIRSLLIPYILWTLLYFMIHAAISRIPVLATVFQEPPIPITWGTIVDAVIHYRYCAFLWFLQFLILYAACSPAVYFLIRSRYAGAAAVFMAFLIACSNVIKNPQAGSAANWIVLYMLGGYIGIHLKGTVEDRTAGGPMLMGTLTTALASFWVYRNIPSVFGVLFYSASFSAALWCALSWNKGRQTHRTMPRAREWQKNTFAVYMTHFMVVQGVNTIAGRYLSQSMWVGFALFLLLPAVCFAGVQLAKKICRNGEWAVWKLLMGNR